MQRGASALAPPVVDGVHGAREDFERRHGRVVSTDAVQQCMARFPLRGTRGVGRSTQARGVDGLGDDAVLGLPLVTLRVGQHARGRIHGGERVDEELCEGKSLMMKGVQ